MGPADLEKDVVQSLLPVALMGRWLGGYMMEGWMDDGRMDGWVDGGGMDGWMNRKMDDRMGGWINR